MGLCQTELNHGPFVPLQACASGFYGPVGQTELKHGHSGASSSLTPLKQGATTRCGSCILSVHAHVTAVSIPHKRMTEAHQHVAYYGSQCQLACLSQPELKHEHSIALALNPRQGPPLLVHDQHASYYEIHQAALVHPLEHDRSQHQFGITLTASRTARATGRRQPELKHGHSTYVGHSSVSATATCRRQPALKHGHNSNVCHSGISGASSWAHKMPMHLLSVQLVFVLGLLDRGQSWVMFRLFLPSPSLTSVSPVTGLSLTISHLFPFSCCVRGERGAQRGRKRGTFSVLPQSRHRPPHGTAPSPRAVPMGESRRRAQTASRSPLPIHPSRGMRVGEATHPGPATQQTVSTEITRTDEASSATTPGQPGAGDLPIQHARIHLKIVGGKTELLTCRWLPRSASWKWGLGPTQSRMAHQSRPPRWH